MAYINIYDRLERMKKMPVIIPGNLPAYKTMGDENIFVMSKERAERQDIRPLEIALVNLMPKK